MAATQMRQTDGLRRLAWVLDDLFRIPGTNLRFGVDALLGLLPGGGDLAGGVISAWTLIAASRAGAPPAVLLRMGLNIAVDAVVGAVPLLGDLFDAGFKANRRNVALLDRYLGEPAPVRRSSRALLVALLAALLLLLAGATWLAVRAAAWLLGRL